MVRERCQRFGARLYLECPPGPTSIFFSTEKGREGGAFVYAYHPPAPTTPIISNLDGDTITYTEGGSGSGLDVGYDAAVSDVDNTDYNGGYLHIQYAANGTTYDQLAVRTVWGIIVYGNEVQFNGTPIGDIDPAYNGVNGADLRILFDAAAANDRAVSRLIHVLRFSNTSENPSTNTRALEITLNDGSADSNAAVVTVNVISVNDRPTLSSFAGPVDTTSADTATALPFAPGTNDTINATNNAYWTPDPDDTGTLDAFEVKAVDDGGKESTSSATVQMSVGGSNNPPATNDGGGGGGGCFINTVTR